MPLALWLWAVTPRPLPFAPVIDGFEEIGMTPLFDLLARADEVI